LFENIEEYAKKRAEEKDESKKDVELVRKIARQYQPEDIRADINAIPI